MTTYSVASFGKFINDSVRMRAYVRALRQVVKASSVVIDIGTGTGIFALLACQFGARRVYAIEPAPVIQLAQEMAIANQFTDRIEFINDFSTHVTDLEPADIIVSDLHGTLPLFERHLSVIADARRRLLAVNGIFIPKRETLWAAVAELPESYGRLTDGWESNPYGLDMRAALRFVTNTAFVEPLTNEQLLVDPQCWASLDYNVIYSPDVRGELTWTIKRPGTAHGVCTWFDSILADGVHFSNAPGSPETPRYSNVFFPLSSPVSVEVGDTVTFGLKAKLTGEEYIWSWNTSVFRQDSADVKASFRQSSFQGYPLSPEQVRKRSANHVPRLTEEALIDRWVLESMDGETSLNEISCRLRERFPNRFDTWYEALSRVAGLSGRYSS